MGPHHLPHAAGADTHQVRLRHVTSNVSQLNITSPPRNVFSIFSVWHRLTSLFDAVDDPRVPIFQTYMHVTAYVLTIIWAIVRPALTFRSGLHKSTHIL